MHQESNCKESESNSRNKGNEEIVQFSIEIPEHIREGFQDAVEKNGKSMKDVLKLYMQKYIWKQSELQRNRQKRRENIG